MTSNKSRKNRIAELVWYFTAMREGEFKDTYISHDAQVMAEGIARLAEICAEQEEDIRKLMFTKFRGRDGNNED